MTSHASSSGTIEMLDRHDSNGIAESETLMTSTRSPGQRRVPVAAVGAAALLAMLAPAASVSAATAAPAPTVPSLSVRLDRELHSFVRAHPAFPGLAIAVRAPGFAWTGAAGVASRASRKPLTPAAPFRIASVTKTFTAAAVLRLVENGKLRLDDPIARHLSASTVALLRRGGYDVDAIRVRNLLQHTSGIYDYAGDQSFQAYVVGHPHHRWTRTEQLRFAVDHGKPLSAPGSAFHYSDTGYILLGEILERETGRDLAAAYRTLLGFDRLGLHHTYLETLEPAPAHTAGRAHQYLGTIDTARFDPSFDLYGGGGLVSTVDDLARFYRALLSGHVYENAATLRTMLGKPRSNQLTDLGMGIFGESIGRETCWHHDGFWGTTVLHCPHTGVTIAITVNQAQSFDTALQQLEPALLKLIGRS